MPHVNDCNVPNNPTRKISTLREFMIICIEIMKDETTLNALYEILDHSCKEGKLSSHIG
jgi:hypothetical protein